MRPVVYVAGPYTKPDPVSNTRAALDEATILLDSGLVAPIVPHLSLHWDLVHPRPYEDWLQLDLDIIRRCHAVYRLPGASAGADREVSWAGCLMLPVFRRREALLEWARHWTLARSREASVG